MAELRQENYLSSQIPPLPIRIKNSNGSRILLIFVIVTVLGLIGSIIVYIHGLVTANNPYFGQLSLSEVKPAEQFFWTIFTKRNYGHLYRFSQSEFTAGILLIFALITVGLTTLVLKTTSSKYAYQITDNGVVFNERFPLVPWRDVAGAKTVTLLGRPFVGIKLNADANYTQDLTPNQKDYLKSSLQLYTAPIVLTGSNKIQNAEDIVALINHYKNIYDTQS